MNLSEPFIRRPVATTLLTLALTMAGAIGYFQLPVSPLPQVDFPRSRYPPVCPVPAQRPWLRRLPHRLNVP